MTTVDQKGKYGRYIQGLLAISDLVLVNVLFFVVFLIDPEVHEFDQKILWLMLNVSFVPVMFLFYNTH